MIVPWLLQAQSIRRDYETYTQAVRLFEEGHYTPAVRRLEALKKHLSDPSLLPDIDYYITRKELLSNPENALDLINAYLVRYPSSPYRQKLMLTAADRYFANGRYKKVKQIIDNMAVYDLGPDERRRIDFYLGYIALKNNDLKQAKHHFRKLKDDPLWGPQAKYYLGYIAYLKNNVVEAQKYFAQVKDKRSQKNIPYYNADMYYRAGMFRQAIDEAMKIYARSRGKEKSQLAKIIGSSYFNLHEYDKAIPYLKAYRGTKGRKSNKDLYELGYAYYQAGDCDNAIGYFNKIIGEETPLAQNAYYHLAKCYLRKGDKQKALNALKKVSEMPFDKDLQEDALYHYIKLGYETGNPYEPIGDAIARYKKRYPASPRNKELEELMLNAYLTSHRYDDALEAMRRNGMTARPEYQKAAYLRGLELFNDGRYEDAIRLLDESIRKGKDIAYRNKALFWKAEALYRLGRYDQARLAYKQFEVNNEDDHSYEAALLPYNLGYVYFKQKQYDKAAEYFSKFVRKPLDDKLLKDAYLRLADSYFASKQYWPAMEAYNQAIKRGGPDADYAFYQKAISYGFVNRDDRKVEELEKFIRQYPRSGLVDDALYQLGSTYLNQGKPAKARQTFDRLVAGYPKSPYVPVALLKAGLAMYNAGNKAKAKDYFKQLIRQHPRSPEAREAAGYLKRIYIDEDKVDDYIAFIKSVDGFDVKTSKLEKDIFDAAREKYFLKNYTGARTALASYLRRFPEGAYRVKAHAYLADIYRQTGEPEKAEPHYQWLVDHGENEYMVDALRFLIARKLQAKQYDQAIPLLEKLEQHAQTEDDTYLAQSKLMYLYDWKGDTAKAAAYAAKVLQNAKATAKQKQKAKLILARKAMAEGDEATAERYYNELAAEATGATAAEALYHKALFQYKKGLYDASNKTVSRLTKKYPSYKKWGAKALIVMARNMYAKGDVFNATYILENIIKRFPQYPEVVREARELLDKIKAEQSQKNSDVKNEK